MTTLFVTASGLNDFRGAPAETNIDRIEFQNPGPDNAIARFNATQFGPGLISNSATIAGNGFGNFINVQLAVAGSFSAAGWQFENWQAGPDVVFITGLVGNDTITGSSQGDRIVPGGGLDHVDAGGGDDEIDIKQALTAGTTLEGGTQLTADEIVVFQPITNDLRPAEITGIERLRFIQSGQGAVLAGDQIGAGGIAEVDSDGQSVSLVVTGNAVDLSGVSFLDWNADDSIAIQGEASGTSTLVGSSQNEAIFAFGTSTAAITGGLGADTLFGAGGNDVFRYQNASDAADGETADGGPGTDAIQVLANVTINLEALQVSDVERLRLAGNAQATLTGNQVNGSEIDEIIGARGVQTLIVTTDDQFTDLSGVAFLTWDDSVDVVKLFGSALQDILTGSDQADLIDGRDQADFMSGRGGDDTYFVDVSGDAIVESAGGGLDRVIAASSYVLAANQEIENLTLTGSANTDATGNALSNAIQGNSGNNRLAGGGGIDTLAGGLGNDTYVNPAGDIVTEGAGAGTDTVESDATVVLADNVERLFLTGSAAASGNGNALANQVNGNGADNTLLGLAGDDTLAGGAGADTLNGGSGTDRLSGGTQRDKLIPGSDANPDTLVFGVLNDSTGVTRDVITGLDLAAEDKLDLPGVPVSIAAAIGTGTLSTATFNTDLAAAVDAAHLGAGQAVLFDPNAGNLDQAGMVYLIVDANGIAGYQANADWVFQLESHTGTLDPSDFI